MNSKHCPHCHFNTLVVKIGTTSSGRQRFKCKRCKKTWTLKPHRQVLAKNIWYRLVFHNQNIAELANHYKVCPRTIRNKLDLYDPPIITPANTMNKADADKVKVIAIDVTYFGRSWGVLTAIDVYSGKALYCAETRGYETIWDYEKAILELLEYGIHPKAAVVDGKKGVINMLEGYGILIQMCQFHQKRIIRTCITKNPEYEENRSLKDISDSLTHTHRDVFETVVYVWRANNFSWINERTYYRDSSGSNSTRKWYYTHKLTRRAINSLYNHLPYLFTFEDHPELNIPNTNNKIEGIHSELKRRLANHRGLKKQQKIKFIRIFLSGRTEV